MQDGVSLRVLLVVGVLAVLVDGAVVLGTCVEEVELHGSLTGVVGLSAHEPVVGALRLASHGDILRRFSLQILRVVPVASHVAYELEGIVVLLVVFGQVGCHLQRRVHHEVECELSAERGVYVRRVVAPFFQACLEDARRVVHRSALQACEGQHDGVVGHRTAERHVLCAACRLVAYEVRPCAADAGGTCSLVSVHHDVVLGSGLDDALIVVVHQLRVVILAARDDVAYVACLHSIVAILVHKVESVLKVSLVVECRRRCLVVHHQTHALRVSILVEIFDVKVGVGRHEVEHIELLMTEPVLPALVPSLDEHLL